MKFNLIRQRRQVMVLYALLITLMFLFVGVGLDLGWYYLNVSRLQNAADAAALAGAQTLVKTEDFNNYLVISLAPNKVPEDFDDYKDAFSNIGNNGDLRNYHKIDDIKDTLKEGRAVVEQYTRENLEDATTVNTAANTTDTVSAIDGWSISADAADKKVSGKSSSSIKSSTARTTFTVRCITSSIWTKKFGTSLCPAGLTTWTRPFEPSCC